MNGPECWLLPADMMGYVFPTYSGSTSAFQSPIVISLDVEVRMIP